MASLSPEDIQSISSGLEKAHPRLRPFEIARDIQDSVPQVRPKDLQDIMEAIASLLGAATAHEEVGFEQFISDVVEAMQRSSSNFPAVNWEGFRSRIHSLLSAKALRVSSRADDIQHEQANSFSGIRILTDIRTVFDDDATEAQGALIIHQLKLTYFCSGEYRDIYIAMDNADLRSIRSAVDRAERKTDTLKKVLQKTTLTYFESTENN